MGTIRVADVGHGGYIGNGRGDRLRAGILDNVEKLVIAASHMGMEYSNE